ncbi:MAG TPA: hypothetical protein DCX95_07840 [Elusimicrobia bacterium]|nr:hypothetical protein [Elusimicrobiota bacterium]
MKKLNITVFIIVLLSNLLSAKGPGTTVANFLKIGVGARPVGLGESFTAVADDVSTIFWNPAGLATIKEQEIVFAYNKWFEDIYQGFVGYSKPLEGIGTFGLGIIYLSMKDIPGYDEWDYKIDPVKSNDMAFAVSYSRTITEDSLSDASIQTGANVKYIRQQLADETGAAVAMDAGILCKLSAVSFGASVQNFGTKMKFNEKEEPLPLSIKFGNAVKLLNNNLVIALDVNFPADNKTYFSVGAEYWLLNILVLRVGYRGKVDLGNGVTLGTGFRIKSVQVDYAFVNYDELKYTHRISVIYKFGESQ